MEALLTIDKIISLFLSFLILLVSLISKQLYRSWLAPGVIFSLAWFIYTFIPLLGAWYIPIAPWGILFILIFCAAFSASGLLFLKVKYSIRALSTELSTSDFSQSHWAFILAVGCAIIVIFCILVNLHIQGFTLESVISSPLSSGRKYLLLRYENLVEKNIFLSIETTLNYVAICLAGSIMPHQQGRLRVTLLVATCFIPSVLHLILYADKGTLFLGIAIFYGAILASRITLRQHKLMTCRTLKILVPCAFGSIVLILLAFLSRTEHTPQSEKLSHILFYFNSYFFGHLFAFSDWMNHYVSSTSDTDFSMPGNPIPGHYTFLVIMQHMPAAIPLPDGFYSEYYRYNNLMQSNIYTMFRGLIQDFGLVGSLLFSFGTGIICHYCYFRLRHARGVTLNSAFYTFFICYTYNSFLISVFSWSNPLLAIILAYSILKICQHDYTYKILSPQKSRY